MTASPRAVKSSTVPEPTLPTNATPALAATPTVSSLVAAARSMAAWAVIRAGQTGQEQPHHLVADQFVDQPVMTNEDRGGYAVELVELPGKV